MEVWNRWVYTSMIVQQSLKKTTSHRHVSDSQVYITILSQATQYHPESKFAAIRC